MLGMRVLFTSWAWPSHLYAMVPLAWACRAAGHEVRFASQPALADAITGTGLPAVAVGTDVDAVGMVRGYVVGGGGASTGSSPRPRALDMVLRLTEAMAGPLIGYARAWRPDLVVYDPTALAGPLAAAAVGVPAVRHLYGTDLLYRARDAVGELIAPLAGRHGLGPVDPLGAATVDPCPPDIQLDADYRRVPVRYLPYNGPGQLPPWLLDPPARPRVCVTGGTTLARVDPALFRPGAIAAALDELDVEVVVAITRTQRALLDPVPGRVRVAESVPLHALLPTCALLVAHGGAGTSLTALASGLPQVLIPSLPDHSGHARRLAAAGAGVVLERAEATPEVVRKTVDGLLASVPHRAAAERLRDAIRSQPVPAAVVADLVEIAGAGPVEPGTTGA
jgi:UDP:flavonoid glycosyltransferase YjiC (YdhE family)